LSPFAKPNANKRLALIPIKERFSEPCDIFPSTCWALKINEVDLIYKIKRQRYGQNIPWQYRRKFGAVIFKNFKEKKSIE